MGCRVDGKNQVITLGTQDLRVGAIAREIFRALGRRYEHSRFDRDKYVTVHWHHILEGKYIHTSSSYIVNEKTYTTIKQV